MEYIIKSGVPSSAVFLVSAVVSSCVSKSTVWTALNYVVPFAAYYVNVVDEADDDDKDETARNIVMSDIITNINYWLISALSLTYVMEHLGGWNIPISIAIYTVCYKKSEIYLLRDVSLAFSALKLMPRTILVFPLTVVAYMSFNESGNYITKSYKYKYLTWRWNTCIALLLCIASFHLSV